MWPATGVTATQSLSVRTGSRGHDPHEGGLGLWLTTDGTIPYPVFAEGSPCGHFLFAKPRGHLAGTGTPVCRSTHVLRGPADRVRVLPCVGGHGLPRLCTTRKDVGPVAWGLVGSGECQRG